MAVSRPLFPEAVESLGLAIVEASHAPLLLLRGDLTTLAASKTFCAAFQINPTNIAGRRLSDLGSGEWGAPKLMSLLAATAAGHATIDAYEMELHRDGKRSRSVVVHAEKLDFGGENDVHVIMTVADVTDARALEKLKDNLLREKAILLQELQHRIANSLQIIAGVLLQSAKTVPSRETRDYLHDAHDRVMTVAAMQQQLAASRLGDVQLRSYFDDLCRSIGASMIRNHNSFTLEVAADDSAVTADVSISLGLIVTELVINALKHAFRGRRKGKIVVDYYAYGEEWTLSVSDNGVGMPLNHVSAKPGLGTGIVAALAQQLDARVEIASGNPGTTVSIVHP